MQTRITQVALDLFRTEGFAAVSIRRLAKEVGCAPMTIYAHFDTKTDILRQLWAGVLDEVFARIEIGVDGIADPKARLQTAARVFVNHWLSHPDQFRLVFMSGNVNRDDVRGFLGDDNTLKRFEYFTGLVMATGINPQHAKIKTDTLTSAMIGIALSLNTIPDLPWSGADEMVNELVRGILA